MDREPAISQALDKLAIDGNVDDRPGKMEFQWIERVIVEPRRSGPPGDDMADRGTPTEPPRQIAPPPADLTPEAWARMVRVSELIEQIAPSEEMPEHVFGLIEGFLRSRFVEHTENPVAI